MLCIKCQALTRVIETREGTKRTRVCLGPVEHRFRTEEKVVTGVYAKDIRCVRHKKQQPAANQLAQ